MSLEVIALADLLENENYSESIVQKILETFKSIRFTGSNQAHDVEDFLKRNAILFNKTDIASTHLIFSEYKSEPVLVAYFTIANKDFYISKRNMEKLSKSLQKKIKQRAQFIEESSVYKLNSFLIGQIGKNYDENALKASKINGFDILNSAFEQSLLAKRIAGGSFIWIEYEDTQKLRDIYESYGFSEIPNYESPNKLKLAIKQLKGRK
ncbi:hypothetical protein [Staphylococcus simulans]|uniref:hypothetical protein n=1 Tax=Staphylococcus simulans TaxID=1286 RepID=UPI0021CF7094|nr:hypothetical protein [Staphylococcus simulans]UXV43466.1 hypothetical protein MUA12_05875 [Staphylococcus simulans]